MDYYEEVVLFLTRMSVAALAAEYKKADDAYRSGDPKMPNWQFDAIEDRLREADPYHPYLVGDGAVMLGLRKNRRESFNEWYMQLPEKPIMVVQPKIDGIAIGLRYVDGKLTEALTKTNRSVLSWIKTVHKIPKQLKRKSIGTVEIHGEIWGFPKDSQDERTPQRIAAVSSKKNEEAGSRSSFAAYNLVGSLTNESQAMEDLRRHGFEVPDTLVCTKPSEVCKLYKQWREGHISELQPFNTRLFKGWPTDGVVAKVFDQRLQRKLGAGSECPNWAIALKSNGIA
jgi:DNA ligase (NAD+)